MKFQCPICKEIVIHNIKDLCKTTVIRRQGKVVSTKSYCALADKDVFLKRVKEKKKTILPK